MKNKLKITWYGAATIKLEINGENILLDPFIRRNRALTRPNLKHLCNVDYILNTYPKFDHLYDAPKILKKSHATIYGSSKMYDILKKQNLDIKDRVKIIQPYDRIQTKETSIVVYPSKYSPNDSAWKKKVFSDALFHMYFKSLKKIHNLHKKFPIGKDVFGYKIKTENFNILALGSAALGDNVQFQDSIDILLLPYEGKTNIETDCLSLIEKINPKIIILHHFDDCVPPITRQMDTEKFIKLIQKKRREIQVISPKFGKSILF